MSRHRNVRSMRYSDEYDGYDDVYGHSVEEDYPMSPSDAAFFYDRNNRPQLSSFMTSEGIEEGDETDPQPESEKKLQESLPALKAIVGDAIPDNELKALLLESNFDVQVAVNNFYAKQDLPAAVPKPQRKAADRVRGNEGKKKGPKIGVPRFNVVEFLKTRVNRNIDFLGPSLPDSRLAHEVRRPQKRLHPLLDAHLSPVGYYLCKKPIEKETVPVQTITFDRIPHDIVPFKFDVNPKGDGPIIKKQ